MAEGRLRWDEIRADIGNPNQSLAIGQHALSQAGTVFGELRKQMLEREKQEWDMKHREAELAETMRHNIAGEDYSKANLKQAWDVHQDTHNLAKETQDEVKRKNKATEELDRFKTNKIELPKALAEISKNQNLAREARIRGDITYQQYKDQQSNLEKARTAFTDIYTGQQSVQQAISENESQVRDIKLQIATFSKTGEMSPESLARANETLDSLEKERKQLDLKATDLSAKNAQLNFMIRGANEGFITYPEMVAFKDNEAKFEEQALLQEGEITKLDRERQNKIDSSITGIIGNKKYELSKSDEASVNSLRSTITYLPIDVTGDLKHILGSYTGKERTEQLALFGDAFSNQRIPDNPYLPLAFKAGINSPITTDSDFKGSQGLASYNMPDLSTSEKTLLEKVVPTPGPADPQLSPEAKQVIINQALNLPKENQFTEDDFKFLTEGKTKLQKPSISKDKTRRIVFDQMSKEEKDKYGIKMPEQISPELINKYEKDYQQERENHYRKAKMFDLIYRENINNPSYKGMSQDEIVRHIFNLILKAQEESKN